MDMKIKAVIEKLFRAHNRRPTDQALENYLEFIDEFSFPVLRETIKRLIENGGSMPSPADVKNMCRSLLGPMRIKCDTCNGKGYKEQPPGKDKYGFSYLESFTTCQCMSPIQDNIKITNQTEIKNHSFGRILARTIALRAISDEVDMKLWLSFWWYKDEGEAKWTLLGSKINNLNTLSDIAGLSEKATKDDCAFYAFDVAKDAIRNGKKVDRKREKMGKRSGYPFR